LLQILIDFADRSRPVIGVGFSENILHMFFYGVKINAQQKDTKGSLKNKLPILGVESLVQQGIVNK
jgi:hypothetical protein